MRTTTRRRAVAVSALGVAAASIALLIVVAQASPSTSLDDAPPVIGGDIDGILPGGGASVDDGYPGVTHLDAQLRSALHDAARDAAADGIRIAITSGWRSPDYQARLVREAVAQYGSEDEAARWVASPATSLHVSGDAVDIGSYDAMEWLAEHGAAYGLCDVYENEPWHFELRSDAPAAGCPPTYRDPTQDPRLQ